MRAWQALWSFSWDHPGAGYRNMALMKNMLQAAVAYTLPSLNVHAFILLFSGRSKRVPVITGTYCSGLPYLIGCEKDFLFAFTSN